MTKMNNLSPSEVSSLSFFSSFIKKHKILPEEQLNKLIAEVKLGQKYKESLIEEKIKAKKAKDLELVREIEDKLKNSKEIKEYYLKRNKLIEHNLKLIINIAFKYSNNGMEFDDLVQEGVAGFIRAIELFDPSMGYKLGTYSTWWIRQKMTRALSNCSRTIRLPVHITSDVTKVLSVIRKYKLDVDEYYLDEICELTNFEKEKVQKIFTYINSFSAINQVGVNFSSSESEDEYPLDDFTSILDKSHPFYESVDFKIYKEKLLVDFNNFFNSCSNKVKEAFKYKYALSEVDEEHSYKDILLQVKEITSMEKSFNDIILLVIEKIFAEDNIEWQK